MVGLIPLFAVETLDSEVIDRLPAFKRRLQWFIENRPELADHIETETTADGRVRRFLALVNRERLRRVLGYMLDEDEFLSPYGIRALSRVHRTRPYVLEMDGTTHTVDYEPAESTIPLFGGNSNWRGPIWMPVNLLLIRALLQLYTYYGDEFKIECPTGSGNYVTLFGAAMEIANRLVNIFARDADGKRAVYGGSEKFQNDPHWRDYILFYEYFHGDNGSARGASHQIASVVAFLADDGASCMTSTTVFADGGRMHSSPGL